MAESYEAIVQLVETLVISLVDEPEAVEVGAEEVAEDELVIEIRVDASDAGKVIGRQGRIIKAIRTLARAAAYRNNIAVEVELIDE